MFLYEKTIYKKKNANSDLFEMALRKKNLALYNYHHILGFYMYVVRILCLILFICSFGYLDVCFESVCKCIYAGR